MIGSDICYWDVHVTRYLGDKLINGNQIALFWLLRWIPIYMEIKNDLCGSFVISEDKLYLGSQIWTFLDDIVRFWLTYKYAKHLLSISPNTN